MEIVKRDSRWLGIFKPEPARTFAWVMEPIVLRVLDEVLLSEEEQVQAMLQLLLEHGRNVPLDILS